MMAQSLRLSAGDTVMPIFPNGPSGIPGFFVSSVHVSPPFSDFHNLQSGPPPHIFHVLRYTCQVDAYNIFGLVRSMIKSAAPAFGLIYKTFFQVFPPSTDLKTPRSSLSP